MLQKVIVSVSLLAACSVASAGVIGYRAGAGGFGGLGGASGFDSLFSAAGDTVGTIDLNNAAAVNALDALWIAGGTNVLNATEQAHLVAFLNSGKNVVYITDRSDVGPWAVSSNSVLGSFGADDIITGGDSAIHATVGAHQLVAGVASIRFNTWSAVNAGLGSPTLLTTNGMAAVYGVGAGELLFIGDTNWQNVVIDTGGADNVTFADNIVSWLTESNNNVPEPGTLALGALALLAAAASRRRGGQLG